ncbi:hypothetical protein LUR59_004661 [Vibrio parahaemolyticus]|uniref:hypothetical protein n=1 Tax=Vibrio parahaemolyticus TaxID=670 RepID=UPI0004D87449|nr:hypothetical protein [Vibrio parahaemolyticus]EIQ1514463.1 hypothetical protein [Vibrio parahaemolyticus]EJT1887624.1 hypothetical protein [Vibrio parahaemolyticus]ELB2775351.1 hypothetical protein [Vibrio parahaemolyticus]OQT97476.1 hypothetical protein EN00_020360 [Vibrio parahaemolyticus]
MELKEFITEALTQIVEGVHEAQVKVDASGAEINPIVRGGIDYVAQNGGGLATANGNYAQLVEFDVAVTVTEGQGTKGGIGIVAGAINLGSTGQSNSENSSVSNLKFKVPVALPQA